MANRFYSPNQQFADATGAPYAGGSLAFYASGTSTPLATYSDSALTIANTNPVVLDSAGRAGNIFLQNLAYKVVLSDVNSNVIWTDDPVYSSDYSARAKFLSGAGSPNGNTAGTAGSTSIGADTYWDTTNNILYVCTQTGTTSTAVWTAVNATSAAGVIPPPQGYLTLTSGTPIIPGDVTATSTIWYTPYVGNLVPIYNGTSFVPTVFSELGLALSNQTANAIYDVFVFNNASALTLAVGPAWATSTAGSGARGTGAGTTQLSRFNGIWVNTVQMSAKNSGTTYTIPANQGTYLGSLYIDAVTGQVSCYRTFGQTRKWGVWNAYNRATIELLGGTNTASWVNAPTTWRQSAGDAANYVMGFCGLAEEEIDISFSQQIQNTVPGGTTSSAQIGIGLNSTTTPNGHQGSSILGIGGSVTIVMTTTARASTVIAPSLGINQLNMIEQAPAGTTNNQFAGSSSGMQMLVRYRG